MGERQRGRRRVSGGGMTSPNTKYRRLTKYQREKGETSEGGMNFSKDRNITERETEKETHAAGELAVGFHALEQRLLVGVAGVGLVKAAELLGLGGRWKDGETRERTDTSKASEREREREREEQQKR